jgi:hypothetical protein
MQDFEEDEIAGEIVTPDEEIEKMDDSQDFNWKSWKTEETVSHDLQSKSSCCSRQIEH